MSATPPDAELDIKGLLCPLPLVRLSQKIATLEMGAVLRAVSDDPTCVSEVSAWAQSTGQELVSSEHEGGDYVFVIKRAK